MKKPSSSATPPVAFSPRLAALAAVLSLAACQGSTSSSSDDAGTGGVGAGGELGGTGGSGGAAGGTTGGDVGGAGGEVGGGGQIGGAGGQGGGGAGGEVPMGACGAVTVVEFATDAVEESDGSLSQLGTTGAASKFDGSCIDGSGSEVAFHYVADAAGTYRFYSGAVTEGLDTILYARTTCEAADTELECNDDANYPDLIDSRIVLDLEAGQELFLIVDAYPLRNGPQGGDIFLNVKPIERVARDGECDTIVMDSACTVGDFCYGELDADGVLADLGACTEDTPPAITSGQSFNVGTQASFVIEGTDTSGDAQGLHVIYQLDDEVLVDMAGDPAEDFIGPLEGTGIYGSASFTLRTLQDYAATFGIEAPNKVTITLFDSQGNESEPQTLDVTAASVRAEGDACDQYRLTDDCPDNTACRTDESSEPATWSCQAIKAPELTSATAWYNGDDGHIAVIVEGIDSDRDVRAPGITLLDLEGADIPLRGDGEVGEAIGEFEPFTYGDAGEFRAVWLFRLVDADGLAEHLGTVRVRIHDKEDLVSEPLDAAISPTVRDIAVGEPCDFWGAENTCTAGLICPLPAEGAAPGEAQICSELVRACPAEFGATDLNEGGAAPEWRASGNTTAGAAHGVGSCGGGAGDEVFTFTAPAAGIYSFLAGSEAEGADTLLYIRSACNYGPEYAGIELECNDDQDENSRLAAVDVELAAEQTVYVFVDGFLDPNGDGWQGPFELVVRQQE